MKKNGALVGRAARNTGFTRHIEHRSGIASALGSGHFDMTTEHHYRLVQRTELRLEQDADGENLTLCLACLLAGKTRSAIGHTSHPEYRGLSLCADCIAHYDRGVETSDVIK